jgi:hypothetical protein
VSDSHKKSLLKHKNHHEKKIKENFEKTGGNFNQKTKKIINLKFNFFLENSNFPIFSTFSKSSFFFNFFENSRNSQAMLSQDLTLFSASQIPLKKIRKKFHAFNRSTDPQISRHFLNFEKILFQKTPRKKFKSEKLFACQLGNFFTHFFSINIF